jgi:hypothetical protein
MSTDEVRGRLRSYVDDYLAALLSHAPEGLPLDPQVRMTENTFAIPIGEGVLWRAMTKAPEDFRVDVVDVLSEQIVVGGLLEVRGRPYLAGIRLRVVNGRIIEVEHLLTDMIQPAAWPNLERPRAALMQDVPLEQRNDRVELQVIANSYFDALTSEDSRRAPFADDCVRHETGLQTTGNSTPPQLLLPQNTPADERERMQILMNGMSVKGAAEQIDSGLFADLWKVWPRRPIVVDEVKGLVAAFPLFIQNGDVRPAPLIGYPGVDRLASPLPFSTQWLEIFKVHSGQIHEIEAPVFIPLGFGASNGWDTGSGL